MEMKGKIKRKINFYPFACSCGVESECCWGLETGLLQKVRVPNRGELGAGKQGDAIIVLLILLLFSSPGERIYHFII